MRALGARSGPNKPISDGRSRKPIPLRIGCRIAWLSEARGEKQMKPSTNDQIKGKFHEVKGDIKEKAGQVANNPDLVAEGQDEKLGGKVQKKVGQIEKVFEK
jgi:uncharacterized protein YjbJ (UPF0337 family)